MSGPDIVERCPTCHQTNAAVFCSDGYHAPVAVYRDFAATITALQAEVAALRPFVQHFAEQSCACGVLHGSVECAPCNARTALERTKP